MRVACTVDGLRGEQVNAGGKGDDAAQCRLSRQQGCVAQQALRRLWPAHELAPPLGQELGGRQVLLRRLPEKRGDAWLSSDP